MQRGQFLSCLEATRGSKTMKNITLSAEERLIEAARKKARALHTSLNQEFRSWLQRYVAPEGEARVRGYRRLMGKLEHVSPGRRFTRDEMNER